MKKITLIVSAAIVSLFITSCDGEGVVDSSHNHDEGVESHEGHDEDSDALRMNDGEKWAVNTEMMVHVRDMEKRMETFSNAESKDFPALAKDLKAGIGELTSSCTMTGESHDELHKWLLPFIKTVDALTDADNDETAANAVRDIEESMITFNAYFE